MDVKINEPANVVVPPTTYDLLGLTEEEVRMIRMGLGAMTFYDFVRSGGKAPDYDQVSTLWDTLREKTGVSYSFNNSPGF